MQTHQPPESILLWVKLALSPRGISIVCYKKSSHHRCHVQLPSGQHRSDYMDDEAYRLLQQELMDNPTAGDVIEGTGGLRKLLKQLLKNELEHRQTGNGDQHGH